MKKVEIIRELRKAAKSLIALEFDTKEEMEKYKKEHEVRKDTKLTVKPQQKSTKKVEKSQSLERKLSKEEFDNEFGKAYGFDEFESFWEEMPDYGCGLIECWDEPENMRINKKGKPSFTYQATGTGWHFDGDEICQSMIKEFGKSEDFNNFKKNNPDAEITTSNKMIRDALYKSEIRSLNKDDFINYRNKIYDDYIKDDTDFNTTEVHPYCKSGNIEEFMDIWNNYAKNIKFLGTGEINGNSLTTLTSLDSTVEVNCDDLYEDCPIHETDDGRKYIDIREKPSK